MVGKSLTLILLKSNQYQNSLQYVPSLKDKELIIKLHKIKLTDPLHANSNNRQIPLL